MRSRLSSRSTRTTLRNQRRAGDRASPTTRRSCAYSTCSAPRGFATSGVVITHFENQPSAVAFRSRLDGLGIKSYLHYPIAGTLRHRAHRLRRGLRQKRVRENDAPARRGDRARPRIGQDGHLPLAALPRAQARQPAGYAKYETFPIWNLPLKHPVNIAPYEAATVDLDDANCIDPFHLEACGRPR